MRCSCGLETGCDDVDNAYGGAIDTHGGASDLVMAIWVQRAKFPSKMG